MHKECCTGLHCPCLTAYAADIGSHNDLYSYSEPQGSVYHVCRSVTMDAWSPDQLRKMQLGGNDTLNNFLSKYSVDKFTEIKDKYNSQAAEVRALF